MVGPDLSSAALSSRYRDSAESAVEKLQTGAEFTAREQFALEAIVSPDKRPAIDIVNGDFKVIHPLCEFKSKSSNLICCTPPLNDLAKLVAFNNAAIYKCKWAGIVCCRQLVTR